MEHFVERKPLISEECEQDKIFSLHRLHCCRFLFFPLHFVFVYIFDQNQCIVQSVGKLQDSGGNEVYCNDLSFWNQWLPVIENAGYTVYTKILDKNSSFVYFFPHEKRQQNTLSRQKFQCRKQVLFLAAERALILCSTIICIHNAAGKFIS